MKQFRLPDPGEGLVEAEIVTWRVAVGDEVKVNDIVVEIETSKSLVELPSPYAGRVTELLADEGQMVDVGTPIITIDDGSSVGAVPPAATDDTGARPEALPQAQSTAGSAPVAEEGERVSVLVGYGPRTTDARRRPRKAASTATDQVVQQQVADVFSTAAPVSRQSDVVDPLSARVDERVGQPLPRPGQAPAEPKIASGPVLAKPPVRKLAKDLGVDLSALSGTGEGGVITRDDVEAAAAPSQQHPDENQPASEPAAETPWAGPAREGGETRVPVKGVRRATAQAMVQSAFTAPHVTEWVTCDVSATVALLERLRSRREFAEVKVSPLLVVAKAVCLALQRTPELNATWDEPAQEIVVKHSVNLGIAAATPRGLVVPVIPAAQALGLAELAGAINDLVATARAGRTQPAQLSGGTFTITNVGVFGVDAGTPILNPGEAGIVCLGQIDRRPWVVGTGTDERIEPRWVTTLAVSFDHRVVDGEQGSRFIADVAALLADPSLALLY